MKKLLVILLALTLALSLAACGQGASSGEPDGGKPGPPEDNAASSSQSKPTQPDEEIPSPAPDLPSPGQTKVEIKDDRVVTTMNDGIGTVTVSEYIYRDDTLSEIKIILQCADSAAARTVYDSMQSGELKPTADAAYSEYKLDGKNIVCNASESTMASFAALSKQELAAILGGDVPPNDTAPGGNAGGTMTINEK